MNSTVGKLNVDEAKAILRGFELRCTAARIAVLQCLHAASSPATGPEVDQQLADYGFDKSTIYRSLTELHEAGIVHRLDLGDAKRRFELAATVGNGIAEHPHFMCVDCGEVVCLSDFTFELKPGSRRSKSPGSISEVLVRGHCTGCSS